jgi:hypothetical protein
MKAPDPPPPPAPAPKPLQLEGSRPDLRIGGQKKMAGSSQRNRVSANSLRGTLNIGGNSGGLNS